MYYNSMKNESGQLEFSGLRPPFDPHLPYSLPELPPASRLDLPLYTPLLIQARASLAHLEGLSSRAKNPLLLISPAITRESVASSGIENIHTTVAEVLRADLLPDSERTGVDKEVLRYRDAIILGARELKKLPLSSRLILSVFKKLMPEHGGDYRKSQNKIESATTREPIDTPPSADKLPGLMSNWEKFVNADDPTIDPLIRCIVAHYQFEAIHPFNDGNGRTGRILMILQLLQYKLLSNPILFISAFLLKERQEYYRTLRQVTVTHSWDEYILFMLRAFCDQASSASSIIQSIDRLHEKTKEHVRAELPKTYSADLVDHLFEYPVTTPTHLAKDLGITYQTASKYLKSLQSKDILKSTKRGTYHFFVNHKLLNIAKA